MIYITLLLNLFFFYLYIREKYYRNLEKEMIHYIILANNEFSRYQYYEKRDYVFNKIHVPFFISDYKLRQIYEKLIHLYPTFPFIL